MKQTPFDYCEADIRPALAAVGVEKGDHIFVHSNLGFFGKLQGGSAQHYYAAFKRAILEQIGSQGTLIVPTFSYSFCKGEDFDPLETKSVCGVFSEMVRLDPEAQRSWDANFSVAALGKEAHYFTAEAAEHSFGPSSFWQRFLERNGKICNFNFDAGSTFIHYVERLLGVPYRYDKAFEGRIIANSTSKPARFIHYVWDQNNKNHAPNFQRFHSQAIEDGSLKLANLGRGQIVSLSALATLNLIRVELLKDSSFLITGPVD